MHQIHLSTTSADHCLYYLSTMPTVYDDHHSIKQLCNIITDINRSNTVQTNAQPAVLERYYYQLHSKTMTIIDIFTHVLMQANQQHQHAVEQNRAQQQLLEKEIQQLRKQHQRQSDKNAEIQKQLIRDNEQLGRTVENLEDILDKLKAEYDLVRNQLQQITKHYSELTKDKECLSEQLREAMAYIQQIHQQNVINEDEQDDDKEDGNQPSSRKKQILRSLKSSHSQYESERSDYSTSNLLYMHSPAQGSQKQFNGKHNFEGSCQRSHKIYDKMSSSPNNKQQQQYYNPTLILNPSLQSSIDVRDRPSCQSINKPAILKQILNLNASYQNSITRLSSYRHYEHSEGQTNERVSIDLIKGEIKTIPHFDVQEEDENSNDRSTSLEENKRNYRNSEVSNDGHKKTKNIRIRDENNVNGLNIIEERDEMKKRKGSAVIGEFTTGQCEQQKYSRIGNNPMIDPYWAFFALTVQCAKINCGRLEQVATANLSSLWDQIITQKLPLHSWQSLISSKLEQFLSEGNSSKKFKKLDKTSRNTKKFEDEKALREKQII